MMNREFQIFVKPAGATCNLHCSYCYYLGKKNLYQGTGNLIMSDETLEKYIIQHIEATTDQIVMFSWHGGEPTLAGIDFFRKVTKLQRRYLPPGKTLLNGIQTNGTLLDEEWCSFLAEEGFIAGISIDGPGELHNRYRVLPRHEGSLQMVLRGFELLKKYKITAEILCVVNSFNVKYPLVVYEFFRDLGAAFITFLPLVEQKLSSLSCVTDRSVGPDEFGKFLISVFDEWASRDIGRIKIQIFEEATRSAFNQDHTLCIFKKTCGGVPVVEHNGDFYSCDHYVDPGHLIGNINHKSLADLLDSPGQKAFGLKKSESLPDYCLKCTVKEMCNGECPKNRFIMSPDGQQGLNYLCPGYRQFFTHCLPFIEAIKEVGLNPER